MVRGEVTIGSMGRYDEIAEWYDSTFRPSLPPPEADVVARFLGPGDGRCLDLGCGTGVAVPVLTALGWSVVGVDASERLLDIARARGVEAVAASADSLPFDDASFDAALSIWIHTDVDDFAAALREAARVLRPGAPLVYLGGHPCFVGPHSRFVGAEGVPSLLPGYRREERYDGGPAISPEGLRAKVGAKHLPLDRFVQAFLDAGLRLERFEELEHGEYPYMVALRWRR
jgi:SAM-dependent methyltransferase